MQGAGHRVPPFSLTALGPGSAALPMLQTEDSEALRGDELVKGRLPVSGELGIKTRQPGSKVYTPNYQRAVFLPSLGMKELRMTTKTQGCTEQANPRWAGAWHLDLTARQFLIQ